MVMMVMLVMVMMMVGMEGPRFIFVCVWLAGLGIFHEAYILILLLIPLSLEVRRKAVGNIHLLWLKCY